MSLRKLLLVILVTIIVGIATVVAVKIFGTPADQANRDAVRQDLMDAGIQAQSVWARPALMAGANRNFASGITEPEILERLNIPGDPDDQDVPTKITNENGVYHLSVSDSITIVITGEPASGPPNLEATVTKNTPDETWNITIEETHSNGS